MMESAVDTDAPSVDLVGDLHIVVLLEVSLRSSCTTKKSLGRLRLSNNDGVT